MREELLPAISVGSKPVSASEFERFREEIGTAILIRRTEQRLLQLFSEGLLFGTVHTSIGQEFVGVAIARALDKQDSIFSNHRGHGHYLARFGDVDGLIAEVMGKSTGVCAGRGGSQHLQRDSYYSNGIQGGIVPVTAGLALAHKLNKSNGIAVVFMGDGTLGQGAVYETMNIASKWLLPMLFVCENNFFAQSTSQLETLAGDICARAEAFGIETIHQNTWQWPELLEATEQCVQKIRTTSRPMFARIDTFRLMAHSKGDDNRPEEFVNKYQTLDPLAQLEQTFGDHPAWMEMIREIDDQIERAVAAAKSAPFGRISVAKQVASTGELKWEKRSFTQDRIVTLVNHGLRTAMNRDPNIVLIGEDIESPYGGAFKCTRDLSTEFPGRVINTPISELSIVGIGNGLALNGKVPVVEIMFGDFMTLVMDQWVNHASKFQFMFNDKVRMPVVIRTPMGGKRGYASTHSQSLEKHFLGLPGTQVFCLHHRMSPALFYENLLASLDLPTLVIENKLLYGTFADDSDPAGFAVVHCGDLVGATTKLKPLAAADLTIVALGGMSMDAEAAVHRLFEEEEIVAELILPSRLYPFDIAPVLESVASTGKLLTVEEGLGFASLSAEIIAQVSEHGLSVKCRRVCSAPVPIPASRPLEAECLPGCDHIVSAAISLMESRVSVG